MGKFHEIGLFKDLETSLFLDEGKELGFGFSFLTLGFAVVFDEGFDIKRGVFLGFGGLGNEGIGFKEFLNVGAVFVGYLENDLGLF